MEAAQVIRGTVRRRRRRRSSAGTGAQEEEAQLIRADGAQEEAVDFSSAWPHASFNL
jgi:hypothetical protein